MKTPNLDIMLGVVLKLGVTLSATIAIIGLIVVLVFGNSTIGENFIVTSIIVLFATPVIRVMASVVSFAMERNALYTIITLIVLINILVSILIIPAMVLR